MSHTPTPAAPGAPADGTAAGLEAAAEVPRGRVITASLVGT